GAGGPCGRHAVCDVARSDGVRPHQASERGPNQAGGVASDVATEGALPTHEVGTVSATRSLAAVESRAPDGATARSYASSCADEPPLVTESAKRRVNDLVPRARARGPHQFIDMD